MYDYNLMDSLTEDNEKLYKILGKICPDPNMSTFNGTSPLFYWPLSLKNS